MKIMEVRLMGSVPPALEVKVNGMSISCLFQKGGKETIVFIHGLGASKESYLEAFRREEFRSFTMLSTDLVGFGDSDKPSDFSYRMKDQAITLKKVIDQLGVDKFHLVAHSMGGIVGIELCEMMPARLCSFINAEGNLTPEDCTVSRVIAKTSEEEFLRVGFDQFKRDLREAFERTSDAAGMAYLNILSKATAESVHRSSLSTVQKSDFGDLFTRFSLLPLYKCYIYGEKNKNMFLGEKLLRQKGIPIFYISRSGHPMMDENPDEFYDLILRIIRRSH